MRQQIIDAIVSACRDLYGTDAIVELERPEEQFGDFATNFAMRLAKPLGQNPRDVAQALATQLQKNTLFSQVGVAGPGFINMTLKNDVLIESLNQAPSKSMSELNIVVEYSDPNLFKVLHAGHLYTSVIGDAIANILESSGATVHRVNFGGDVGLHVAKAMWGIIESLEGEYPEKLNAISEQERADWISKCYVRGNEAYESGSKKEEIVEINKHVYRLHTENEHDSPFAQIYWKCREWSYEYFYSFYKSIGTAFEKYYPESETAPIGLETVKKELKSGIYEESNGAVVFKGEKYGLHTRVFINSEGLPTYEAKDVGLAIKKWQDYKFDRSIMITGNDIVEYMKVVMKSIEQYAPEITDRTTHITHGMVKLKGGIKMSSRQGNFLKATDVLQIVVDENLEANPITVLAAIKYAFLKYSIGGDISFDPKESIAMEGNSGPYLQYAHARAKSILRKSEFQSPEIQLDTTLDTHERSLVRKLTEYSEVIEKAIFELAPHVICAYLYELSQEFNRFYENSTVIGDSREKLRTGLVNKYANTLKDGLTLLGIEAPDSM